MAVNRHVAPRHPFRLDIGREWSVVWGMRDAPKKAAQSDSTEALAAAISRLADLPLKELKGAPNSAASRRRGYGGITY